MHRYRVALLVVALGLATGAVAQQQPAMPEPTVKIGQLAPDFKLPDQNGKEVSLSEFRGKKNVALAFYIFAFSGG